MTSVSSFGNSTITLQFVLDRDIDAAAQDVQAAMNAANGVLPQNAQPADLQQGQPRRHARSSPCPSPPTRCRWKRSTTWPTPSSRRSSAKSPASAWSPSRATRSPPCACASIPRRPRRAWGSSLEDVRTALMQNNVNAPKGSFDGPRQSYAIGANDQIFSAADYANVIVAYRNGAPVRLRDIGEVIDNVENVRLAGWVDDKPAVILDIQRQPGANIIETADRVKALLPRLRASIPPSVKIAILTDRTETIRASVRDVQFTLLLTVSLVVMVIFVFLRKFWATVIPSVALPLAIIGTFGVMKLVGFSLDNLSLMALTISTGFVVDDAIVMIENIVRYIEAGETAAGGGAQGRASKSASPSSR